MIQQLYKQIETKSSSHSILELCKLYGVSRSGYYKWKNRAGTLNQYEQQQKELDIRVQDIHNHYPMMGYRQIRDSLLLCTGWKVCDISVWRSMKRLRIRGYTRRPKPIPTQGLEHHIHPNVLNREFYTDKPFEKIATDITYIKHKEKWYYLSCFLDLYNNEILEWELSDTPDTLLVIRPAKRLLEKKTRTEHPILLHSDQGVQYVSSGYSALLKEYGITQSMSRAGTPRDNAVIESFFGKFKDTLRFHFRYFEQDNLHEVISQAVHYFNHIRPIRKLNGKPPVPFRLELTA